MIEALLYEIWITLVFHPYPEYSRLEVYFQNKQTSVRCYISKNDCVTEL
jgi:hypothetical protein